MGSDLGESGCYIIEQGGKRLTFEIYKWNNDIITDVEYIKNSNSEITRLKKMHRKLEGRVLFLEDIPASSCVAYQIKDGFELYGIDACIQKEGYSLSICYESKTDGEWQVENDFKKLIYSIRSK